jgi:adenylate kinase
VRVALTGTPGTGKSTVAERIGAESDGDLRVIHLNEAVQEHGLWTERDDERDSLVVDLEAAADWLGEWDGLLESHLAHYFDADRVVVLRCRPDQLKRRLLDRGEPEPKAAENADSEALDVVLSEAVDRHGRDVVYEIDTTDRTPEAVAADVRAVLRGERDPSAGEVDFTDYL